MNKNDRIVSRKDVAFHGNMTSDYTVSQKWRKIFFRWLHLITWSLQIKPKRSTSDPNTPRHVRATCGIFQKLKSLKSSSASENAGSLMDLVDWDTDTGPVAAEPHCGESASVLREEEAEE
jgi:hypothetical protein